MSDLKKLALPNITTAPPGGWRYTVPETKQSFAESNLEALLKTLKAHYRATGYDVPLDLVERIEAFICAEVPEYCGAGPSALSQVVGKIEDAVLTFHAVIQGMRTLAGWVAGSGERVALEVAEKRASICARCPLNVQPKGCTGCNMGVLRQLTEKFVGGKRTSYYEQLKACKACACQLNAKVHLPRSNIWPKMSEKQKAQLPSECWLVTEGDAK